MTIPNSEPIFLLDSNVLVYAHDVAERDKQPRGLDVLRILTRNRRGSVSAQVLGEFFRAVTQRIPVPLPRSEAEERLADYATVFAVFPTTLAGILEGARGVSAHSLSVWDSVIWATAKQNGVLTILSEDQQHGRLVEGVRYLNPFAPNFDLAQLDSV